MLCASAMGRMAAMERLLAMGNVSETSQEEANREKQVAKAIYKDLNEADEANLLEESDMHVFDSKPMTDPLHLVCCNACKKPVKASQYAAHAERCGALISTDGTGLELDGGNGPKKPPRKGRKKVHVSQDNQTATNVEQERSESLEGDDTAASESANMDELHTGIATSLSRELKRKIHSRSSTHSAIVGINHPYDSTLGSQDSRQALESIAKADGPAPLATKVYRFQRNQQLRAALGKLYSETVAKEHSNDSVSPSLPKSNGRPSLQVSSPSNLLNKTSNEDTNQKKKDGLTLPVVRKPDQILAQSSESCLGIGGAYPSLMNITNQFPNNNFARPVLTLENGSVAMTRKGYLSSSYSYPVNPGNMQQPNGIAPAV